MLKAIYSSALILGTAFIWGLLYAAQFEEYDSNYAFIIYAFLTSVVLTVLVLFIWTKWRHFVRTNAWVTSIFLLLNNPLTIMMVFMYYQNLFGPLKD